MNLIDDTQFKIYEPQTKSFQTVAELNDFLRLIQAAHKFQHIAFAIMNARNTSFEPTLVWGTYPSDWLKLYQEHQLGLIDPVISRMRDGNPVVWKHLTDLTEQEQRVLDMKLAHGIGPAGLTIPTFSTDGHISYLSIAFEKGDEKQIDCVLLKEFSDIAILCHSVFLRLSGITPPKISLSDRQLDCIELLAKGMHLENVAAFLKITPRSVAKHLADARSRLVASNNTQMIYNAARIGLITIKK